MTTEQKKVVNVLQKQKKKRGKRQRKEAPPATAQRTLDYIAMYENGVCEAAPGHYSKTLSLSDINYQTARQEEQFNIFGDYCELLNACDPSTTLQLTLMNKRIDIDSFEKELFYELTEDEQDVYRHELNAMLKKNVEEGQSNFVREKYTTFSVKASNLEEATRFLDRTEMELMGNFETMEVECQALTGIERLKVCHDIMKPDDLFHFSYEDLLYSGLATKSAIAPSGFNFKHSKNAFEMGDGFAQVIYLKDYPSNLSDKLIMEIMDIPEELTLSIHFQPTAQDEANQLVKSKKMFMESEKSNHQQKNIQKNISPDLLPYELKDSLKEADALLEDLLSRGQKLFYTTFVVMVRAETEEKLHDVVEQVRSVGRKKDCGFSKLEYLQEKGLNTTLPFGRNVVDIERTLTTANAAIFIPFTAQDLHHKGGKYYGINKLTKNVVMVNRQKLNTPSGFILGSSGSGKGVSKKVEMITTLLKYPKDEIISIDPEDEDAEIAKAFGGQMIKISPNTTTHLNLLDITEDLNGEEDPVRLKSDFLLTAFENLIGGNVGLSSSARSMIDRVTRLTFMDYLNKDNVPMPTLQEWFKLLKEQPEPEAQSLALSLEVYIEGSLDIFSHATNVELSNRFIIYNTKQLGGQLKTFGMMVVLDQVWNRIVRNRERGIRTWLYIDEMQLMLNDEYCENYFFELWSRIRKWGAIPTGITQNVETLLLSDKARRSLSNSEFIIMLKQAKSDQVELEKLFGLSYEQSKYLVNPEKGAGLIRAGNAIIPFTNTLNKDMTLYDLVTTDPEEVLKLKKRQEAN